MQYRILLLLLFLSGMTFSQGPVKMEWSKIGTIDPRSIKEDWNIRLQNMEMPSPDGESYKAELLRRKAKLQRRFPRKYSGDWRGGDLPIDSLPLIDTSFLINDGPSGTPSDNSMCINNDGILISAINSRFNIFDTEADTMLMDMSLGQFTFSMGMWSSKYDPKLIYDNEQDRFVMIFLNGYSSTQSAIVALFSSTADPLDPWHMYAVNGNPFDSTQWTDYPALNLTKNELFVTGNLLGDGLSWQQGFQGTIIWQIDKFSGYNGDTTLTAQVWGPVDYNGLKIRNLHPVRIGRGVYTDNQYFLSNRNFSIESDTFYLVEITDKASGSPQLNVDLIHSPDHYFLAVNAPQADSQFLQTNDSRVLGAILEEETIQFVGNTTDTTTGNSAFYVGTLNLNDRTINLDIVGDSIMNFGYPNIAYAGVEFGEQRCIVAFEYCPTGGFPGYAAIYRDDTGQYSPVKIIRQGDGQIDVLSGADERWGDYSGIQRKYNEPCKIWCTGTFGKSDNDNGNWVARLAASDSCRALPVPPSPQEPEVNYDGPYEGIVFPNPADDMFSIAFTLDEDIDAEIAIYDMRGRKLRVLYKDIIKQGENLLSFATTYLSAGIYILRITAGDEVILNEKIVKRE